MAGAYKSVCRPQHDGTHKLGIARLCCSAVACVISYKSSLAVLKAAAAKLNLSTAQPVPKPRGREVSS